MQMQRPTFDSPSGRGAPLLLVIDMQPGFDDLGFGVRSNPGCETRVAEMLSAWRNSGFTVFFTRYLSSRPDSPLAESDPRSGITCEVRPLPGEPVFAKRTNSAFKAEGLAAAVARLAPSVVVLAGIVTDICVSATAREAIDLGYRVAVASDACAAFDRTVQSGANFTSEDVHQLALAALAASGATIASAQELAQRLCPAARG